MRRLITVSLTFSIVSFFYLIFPQKSHAYLDPGTGSYILQLLAASIFGVLFVGKLYWSKVKTLWKKLFLSGEDVENPGD